MNYEPKSVKRIVCWRAMPILNTEMITYKITYILDSGNLINDVRKKYTDLVSCKTLADSERKEAFMERSRKKLIRDLEQKIRATGANELNAEIMARKLLNR